MRLELALNTVVSERFITLVDSEKLLELAVRENLALVLGVLETVVLNVGADSLGHINAGLEVVGAASNKLCHLLGDCNLFEETRVDVSTLLRLLTHYAKRLGLETLDSFANVLQKLGSRALGSPKILDLSVEVCQKLVEMLSNRLASSFKTRNFDDLSLRRNGGNKRLATRELGLGSLGLRLGSRLGLGLGLGLSLGSLGSSLGLGLGSLGLSLGS